MKKVILLIMLTWLVAAGACTDSQEQTAVTANKPAAEVNKEKSAPPRTPELLSEPRTAKVKTVPKTPAGIKPDPGPPQTAPEDHPRLVMPRTSIELDRKIIEGEKIKGEFELTNQGQADLIIKRVVPG